MKIAIVTVGYGLAEDLRMLFFSAQSARHEVEWHVFLHSNYEDVVAVCEEQASKPGTVYYPYGVNRGLARSWNEGILAGYAGGADMVLIANDDMLVGDGDLDILVEYAVSQQDKYIVMAWGYQVRDDKYMPMNFGFTVIQPIAIEKIGLFDENFFPIYYEDADYRRRALLAGLDAAVCMDTECIHQGSKNIHTVPGLLEENKRTHALNRAYYERKWGGHIGREIYSRPFGNGDFDLRIAPDMRIAPYPGYDREDLKR